MKKLLWIALLTVLVGAGLSVWMLDRIIATAVEKGGSAVTGVATRVDSVDAGFFQGHLGFGGLTLDNPPGFSERKFLACEELRAEWDNGTILDATLRVRELRVRGLTLELERTQAGGNWQRILDQISSNKSASREPAQSASDSREVVIDHIVLEDIRCGLTLSDAPLVGGRRELGLPRLELKGLKTNGDAAHIAGVVLDALIEATLQEIARSGGDFLPKDVLKDVEGQLKALEKSLRHELESGLRGLLNGAK